jgi:K+-transporting ATPase ATPase C chain
MKHLKISVLMLFIFTIITGVVYPLLITGIGIIIFPEKRNGSLIVKNGSVIGSELIGQKFEKAEFFHGRPSAVSYDASSSGGSNYGPMNKKFIEEIQNRSVQIRKKYNMNEKTPLPSDFLFSSGSGLDPHISLESVKLQVDKIAFSRKINKSIIENIIDRNIIKQYYFIGQPYLNVLKINMELNEKGNLE